MSLQICRSSKTYIDNHEKMRLLSNILAIPTWFFFLSNPTWLRERKKKKERDVTFAYSISWRLCTRYCRSGSSHVQSPFAPISCSYNQISWLHYLWQEREGRYLFVGVSKWQRRIGVAFRWCGLLVSFGWSSPLSPSSIALVSLLDWMIFSGVHQEEGYIYGKGSFVISVLNPTSSLCLHF